LRVVKTRILLQTINVEAENVLSLREVVTGFKSSNLKPLIGRVLRKTRLFHFGKLTLPGAYLMNFSFVLSKGSCLVSLKVTATARWRLLCGMTFAWRCLRT